MLALGVSRPTDGLQLGSTMELRSCIFLQAFDPLYSDGFRFVRDGLSPTT